MWNTFFPSNEDAAQEPQPDEEELPRSLTDRRAAAQSLRATTRAASRTTSASGHLAAPNPQERIRSISRSRSPTPTPSPTQAPPSFDFPNAKMIDEETVKRITAEAVEYALRKDREE